MKKLTKSFYIRIAIPFTIAFIMSFLTSSVPPSVFGDWKCQGRTTIEVKEHTHNGDIFYSDKIKGCRYLGAFESDHEQIFHWGFRRYIFFAMSLVLFIYSMIKAFDNE